MLFFSFWTINQADSSCLADFVVFIGGLFLKKHGTQLCKCGMISRLVRSSCKVSKMEKLELCMKNIAEKKQVVFSEMDDTEKDFSEISIEFRKIVLSSGLAVKKMVKAALRKDLSHVNENGVRLIHWKA